MSAPTVSCPSCRYEVPADNYCVRCGQPLGGAPTRDAAEARSSERRQYGASSHESVRRPAIVSTLLPRLPDDGMPAFRAMLALGIAVVVGLAAFGLYPIALVAAAVLVPAVVTIYLYDVDVYEDQPFRVLLVTLVWGALAGVLVALVANLLDSPIPETTTAASPQRVLGRGVLIPLLSLSLIVAGPLVLLAARDRFNDVLDGVAFGTTAGASFASALLVAQAFPLLAAGAEPVGATWAWIARLLLLVAALPLLTAAASGAVAASFWLRFRGSLRDRGALGRLGSPPLAFAGATLLLVLAALAQLWLPLLVAVAVVVVLDVIALLWLRRLIHIGLLEEAAEIEIGPPVRCSSCDQQTAAHTFCQYCGVSLRALPKARRSKAPSMTSPRPTT